MNNPIIKQIVVINGWQPLWPTRLIASVEISTPPDNSSDVSFRVKGSDPDSPTDSNQWVPGEYHTFRGVDLSQIEVLGYEGDIVTINGVGGTF